MEITIGTSFMKQFGKAGLFRGVVVLKHKDAEIGFRVKYEDGDEEVRLSSQVKFKPPKIIDQRKQN